MTSPHPPIVLIHGLYMNVASWQPWIERARAQKRQARAIEWPGHSGDPAELRAYPPAGLGSLSFEDVLEPVRRDIEARGDDPVLVGHSIGGLMVLRLLSEGIGRAGVAITPAPPRGFFSASPHFFAANLPHVNALAGSKILEMSKRRFHYTFGNTSSREESDAAFDEWCVPESRRIPLSTLGHEGAVDLAMTKAPLLLLGAEKDHLIPSGMVRRLGNAYARVGVPVEHRLVRGKSHLLCNQTGWESLADDIFAWADRHA